MDFQSVEVAFKEHWRKGWGSVAPDEIMYIDSLIKAHKPQDFIEVGMASGLSGGFIASSLEENEGKRFVTLDYNDSFFGDPSKNNGFLIEKIYKGHKVEIQKRPFTTALDLPKLGMRFDMAFVDANHQHPWPLIDTLCLYPYMRGEKIVIHHDLCLYRKSIMPLGIGPKYLFDQFPESHREQAKAKKGNIFHLRLDLEKSKMEEIAINALLLPWSIRTPLSEQQVSDIRQILRNHYSPALSYIFRGSVERFNTVLPNVNRPTDKSKIAACLARFRNGLKLFRDRA